MKEISIVCFALFLTACAVPTTGVMPVSDGYYSVAHQGGGAWVSTQELKSTALKEAQAFCQAKGKDLKVVNVKEIPAGPMGRWPEADATFMCI